MAKEKKKIKSKVSPETRRKKETKKKIMSRLKTLFSYLYDKWEEIVESGDYRMSTFNRKGKEIWTVCKKGEMKDTMQGSYKQCMDFIIEQWMYKKLSK